MNLITQADLRESIATCKAQMAELGYTIPPMQYEISKRLTRSLGLFTYSRKYKKALSIKVSADLTKEMLNDTMIHEMIHSVVPHAGHGYDFQRIARQVNQRFGYNVGTYASKEESAEIKKVRQARMAKVVCDGCGQVSLIKPNTALFHRVLTGQCSCKICKSKSFHRE